MDAINPYRKAIAALVGAVVSAAVVFNIDIDEELQAAIITLVSTIAVFVAPPNTSQ